ncbi:MAG: GNAT family N-acetyltransferase [Croceibacterium sp.]
MLIREAHGAADMAAFARLCRDYVDWNRTRYADLAWLVDAIFAHQSLEAEQAALPGDFGPPGGAIVLAERDGQIVAGGAYRRLDSQTCEMKRLYVAPEASGVGLGRQLAGALIDHAQAANYTAMVLDTGDRLHEAQALYASLGFVPVPMYRDYPEALQPHILSYRLALRSV